MNSIKYCSAFFLALTLTSTNGYGAGTSGERMGTDTETEREQSGGGFISDALITTKVKAAIINDASLSAFDINVETNQGNVQLNGFVDS